MSIRQSLQEVLRVAPAKGTQHATNALAAATGNATPHATTDRKASKHAEASATPDATHTQQQGKNSATNYATQPPPAQHITQQAHKAQLETDALTGDLAAICKWLAFIGEHDPACINEVLETCRADAEVQRYFVGRAGEADK